MTYGEPNLLQAIVSVGILRDLENVISSATMPGILVVATEQLAVASGVAIFRESAQTRERHQHRGSRCRSTRTRHPRFGVRNMEGSVLVSPGRGLTIFGLPW